MRRWLALVGWLGFMAGSLAGLHRLGRWFPIDLILQPGAPLEPGLAAAFRLLGLAAGYWLMGTTMLYLVGRAAGLPAALRAVGWATIGPVRRLVDGIAAGALVAAIGFPTIVGALTEPGYVPVPAGDPVAADPAPSETTAKDDSDLRAPPRSPISGTPFPPVSPVANPGTADPDPAVRNIGGDRETEIVVQPGDHMWALAGRRLALVMGREASDSEIAPYWLKMIASNLAQIRSGDPDLIFPGEILLLPAVDP